MSHPKPTGLIQYLIRTVTSDDDLIMDFYAGSATTAHAVMGTNAEDGAKRRYILIQLDESCDAESEAFKSGFRTIAQLAQERIRRAGTNIKNANAATAPSIDIGFRSLRLSTSNMNDVYYAHDALSQSDLLIQTENIKNDRSAEDLLFQVLLDWGVDLALPIEKQSIFGKNVFFVDTDALAACFDAEVDEKLITYLANKKPMRAVFRDSCFSDDSAKINIEQIFKMLSPSTQLKGL
jgi:adenine-specific DNA-methyltransferase